uniref:Uncharacterized protein n=1 Tax=Photinus pyralis TaxID=7054 RepID=A0A1Y1M9K2_PHOPY
MGSNLSRVQNGFKEEGDEKLPSAPIQTPQTRRLEFDPRSPSSHISRTPIEVLRTPLPKEASTCHSISVLDCNVSNEIDIDPRSPTADFHRTPLMIKGETKLPYGVHNKFLDKARRPPVTLTPLKQSAQVISTISNDVLEDTPPKLLETNTKLVKHIENKRHSFIGLLETNIDYVETDIDNVIIREKELNSDVDPLPVEVESGTAITESNQSENSYLPDIPDEETCSNISDASEAIPDITKCITEIDRKLTNLIYEDKEVNISPKVSKPIESGHRTPLSDRNANNQTKRTIPVLKVSDKPTKLQKGSKIPILKGKDLKGAFGQCENTPPRLKNRSHWGKEDSLVI